MKSKKFFAAVCSDYPLDGKKTGYCDEWVETYSTLDEATKVCQTWAKMYPGKNVRIFVAEGLNLNGEYGEMIVAL
jgi:pyruvoyl-dependent arginine decarboxylase (PvlArgDC)